MSGGQPSIRGYLIQTLIALLDALAKDRPWEYVRLEPADPELEKIDLLWEQATGTRAVQVKSSQNQIGKADAERWAGELETHHGGADELELVLVGPCAQSVVQLGRAGRVTIPPPVPLNLGLLCQAAAHRLALFLESQNASAGRADQREALVRQLGWRLAQWSAESHRLSRAELAGLLEAWSREEAAKLPQFPIFTAPQRNPFFTGREAELELLHTRLRTAGRAVLSQTQAISGLGGVGKTQTVLEYAHQVRGDYDAVFWISAASELELRTGYAQIAARLGLPHDAGDAEGAMRAARHWLESSPDRRWLLVFDNADDPQVLEVLQGWLPSGSSAGHVLVTSRARVLEALGLVSPLALETLPAAESTAFLLKRTGRQQAEAGEVTGASELAAELDGLPLALEQAAAYVLDRDVPFAEYLASYRRQRLALLEQRGPQSGAYPQTVATTWLLNFQQVSAESAAAAELLRLSAFLGAGAIPFELLSAGRGELGETIQAALAADESLSVYELLKPLARFSLVRVDRTERMYSVHRLVQEVTKWQLSEASRRAWAERAVRGLDAAFPSPDFENWERCERLTSPALAACELVATYGLRREESATLINTVALYLHARGRYSAAEPLYQQILGLNREMLGEHHADVAGSLNNLASLYYHMGRYQPAELLYQQAVEVCREVLGDQHTDFARTLNNLAGLNYATGQYEAAESLHRQVLGIRRHALGEQHPEFAQSLNNLAEIFRATGRYKQAESLYKQALEIRRRMLGEQHPDFARSISNLAELYRVTGRYGAAEPLYQQALEIRRKMLGEQHPDFAFTLSNQALLYVCMGRYDVAEPLYQQALEIRRRMLGEQHPDFAGTLFNLAALYDATGRFEQAEPLYQQALDVFCQVLGPNHPHTKTVQANYDRARRAR